MKVFHFKWPLEFIESRVHTNWHKKVGVTGRRLRPVRGVAEKTGAQVLQGKTWSACATRGARTLERRAGALLNFCAYLCESVVNSRRKNLCL